MKVFIGACAGMLMFGVTLITLGSVATHLGGRFSLSSTQAGALFSILPFGILLGSPVFGPLSERYGYKPVLTAASFIMCAGFQGIAYADTLPVLRAFVLLFGFGGGIMNGATNAVVSDMPGNNKAADMSLLGVFYGIGALGMPLLLGSLGDRLQPMQAVSLAGGLTGALGIYFMEIRFPPPRNTDQSSGIHIRDLMNPLLFLIGMFLFFQSSLEALINNWSTTFVTSRGVMDTDKALFALSLHMAGMVCMRVLSATLLRRVHERRLLAGSLAMLGFGVCLMISRENPTLVVCGLILTGAGLSAGFPVMLSIAGKAFPTRSASAFSLLFTIALAGNMIVNYLMGILADRYGIGHLTTLCLIGVACMALLLYLVNGKIPQQLKK